MTDLMRSEATPTADAPRVFMAIDPGPVESAYVWFDRDSGPVSWTKLRNAELLRDLGAWNPSLVVIEKVESFGMAVGAEIFETVRWSGRIEQEAVRNGAKVERIGRRDVKVHLCGSSKARDANVRQSLIDRYGPGKELAVGTKGRPGPLYGFAKDGWAALAVAVTWADTVGGTR